MDRSRRLLLADGAKKMGQYTLTAAVMLGACEPRYGVATIGIQNRGAQPVQVVAELPNSRTPLERFAIEPGKTHVLFQYDERSARDRTKDAVLSRVSGVRFESGECVLARSGAALAELTEQNVRSYGWLVVFDPHAQACTSSLAGSGVP